jgi:hypothetical protein
MILFLLLADNEICSKIIYNSLLVWMFSKVACHIAKGGL